MDINSFIWGVAASITAALIIFFLKTQISSIVSYLLFRIYPKIAGKYRIIHLTDSVAKNQKDILRLSQFGPKIWGENNTFENDKIVATDKIKGRITPSRILVFEFETVTAEHHNFGSATFIVGQNISKMKGYLTCLCGNCGSATSHEVQLERIQD